MEKEKQPELTAEEITEGFSEQPIGGEAESEDDGLQKSSIILEKDKNSDEFEEVEKIIKADIGMPKSMTRSVQMYSNSKADDSVDFGKYGCNVSVEYGRNVRANVKKAYLGILAYLSKSSGHELIPLRFLPKQEKPDGSGHIQDLALFITFTDKRNEKTGMFEESVDFVEVSFYEKTDQPKRFVIMSDENGKAIITASLVRFSLDENAACSVRLFDESYDMPYYKEIMEYVNEFNGGYRSAKLKDIKDELSEVIKDAYAKDKARIDAMIGAAPCKEEGKQ